MVIEEVPRYQRLRRRDFALVAAAYAVAMAGGAFSSTVWISPQFLMSMVVGIWLVVGAVTFLLVRRAVALVLIWAMLLAVLVPAFLVQRAVLYERGVRHIAVVLDAHPIMEKYRESGLWRYQVSTADGVVPGWLRTYGGLEPGNEIIVYTDPQGEFHPMLVTDVEGDSHGYTPTVALLALIYGVLLEILWLGTRSRTARIRPRGTRR